MAKGLGGVKPASAAKARLAAVAFCVSRGAVHPVPEQGVAPPLTTLYPAIAASDSGRKPLRAPTVLAIGDKVALRNRRS